MADPEFSTHLLRAYLAARGTPALVLACPPECRGGEPSPASSGAAPSPARAEADGEAAPVVAHAPGCLGSYGPAPVLELALAGEVRLAPCPAAERAAADATALATAAGARVRVLGDAPDGPAISAAHPPLPRRALLGGGPAAAPGPEHPRVRLTLAVRALQERYGGPGLADLDSGALTFDGRGCVGDGLCVRVCPQHALGLRVDGDAARRFTLWVDPARCDGCRRCLSVCPHDALHAAGTLSWAQAAQARPTVVRGGMLVTCERCGAPTQGGRRLCALCRARAEQPFGVIAPPGFRLDPGTGGLVRDEGAGES